jgi:hypothetical protein
LIGNVELGECRRVSGLSVEGSVRVGQVKTDYDTTDTHNSLGIKEVKYDYNALYYGLHIGCVYKCKVEKKDRNRRVWQAYISKARRKRCKANRWRKYKV